LYRQESQNRMIALKERAEKEHQVYIQELKELERRYQEEKKLREFMSIKNSERADLSTPQHHSKISLSNISPLIMNL
jgi:predicted nucleotidyltransferase